MEPFILLLLRNLGRNKARTALTGMAVVVLMAVYTFTFAVTDKVDRIVGAHSSQNRLLISEKWVLPSQFPVRYVAKIAEVEGVEDWTPWHLYGGYLDDAGYMVAGIATRVDNLSQMHPGLESLDPALLERMKQEKEAVLIGEATMQRMNWKLGQKFTITSFTHVGKNLEFRVLGVLPSDLWPRNFFFREDYYQEATGDRENVDVVWVRVAGGESAKRVAARIERLFENSRDKLRAETESAGMSRIIGRVEAFLRILDFVVVILIVDIAAVLANSISMTVRERRHEVAILKILGFPPSYVLMLIIGEAMLVGAVGGVLGGAAACALSTLNSAGALPVKIEFLLEFPVGPKFIFQGLLIGIFVGFVGSVIPAWNAQRIRVVEAFAKAG